MKATLKLLMKETVNHLTVLAASMLLATGCAGLAPKPAGEPEADYVVTGGRIDVPKIITSADDAGCVIGAILYEEGRRTSNLGLYCEGSDLPVPARFNDSK